jgi:hypothetical protein
MPYSLSVVKQEILTAKGGKSLVPLCWGHERLAAWHMRDTMKMRLSPHGYQLYTVTSENSIDLQHLGLPTPPIYITADTEMRNWIRSISLQQFKANTCAPCARFEVFATAKTLIAFFWIVTSHGLVSGYRLLGGIFFFRLKFRSEVWCSRFVRNVCSDLRYYWRTLSQPKDHYNYTNLEAFRFGYHARKFYTTGVALVLHLNYKQM